MSTEQEQEQEQENSLTAPNDRDRSKNWRPQQAAAPLSEDEVTAAMQELNDQHFINKFPRVDRTYADPVLPMQNLALFSFTPAKGAKPNGAGVYGFGKIRGTFSTPIEANERAEFLIRNADSYHNIFHTYVGRPFPVTMSSKYSAETAEIDIRKELTQSVSNTVKEKKLQEERTTREIKEREENLIQESRADPDDVDPYDEYITLKVKKAQLSWTYLEHLKKIDEIKHIIFKTRNQLEVLDQTNSEFKEKYYDKYMKARSESGFDQGKSTDANFLKFLVEDTELPGIDCALSLDPADLTRSLPSE